MTCREMVNRGFIELSRDESVEQAVQRKECLAEREMR